MDSDWLVMREADVQRGEDDLIGQGHEKEFLEKSGRVVVHDDRLGRQEVGREVDESRDGRGRQEAAECERVAETVGLDDRQLVH